MSRPPHPLRRRRPRHVRFLDMPFGQLHQAEVIRLIVEQSAGPYRYIVTPNAYDVVSAHDQPKRLLPIYQAAWLSVCDSRIVRALARLERNILPLVTGSDLVARLLATLNDQDRAQPPKRILVVGPSSAVGPMLHGVYPNVPLEVLPAPYGLAQSAALRREVARTCMEREWDIALLCVGCPAQALIAQQLGELGRKAGIALCVGASIDFLVGKRSRAPLWLQRLGLEWAYRLACEPARLWRRYLVESPRIFRIFMATRALRGR